ncbi:hypothetical protein AAY473_027287 [Plecturocebus cupreus]
MVWVPTTPMSTSSSPATMSWVAKHHGWLCLLFLVNHTNTEEQWVLAVLLGLLAQLFACHVGVGLGCSLSCALGPRAPNAAPAGFFLLVLHCLQHLEGVPNLSSNNWSNLLVTTQPKPSCKCPGMMVAQRQVPPRVAVGCPDPGVPASALPTDPSFCF